MLKYNICFLKQGDKVLLLNRERASWMGAWNGVGGKVEHNESPRASVLREVQEETGIALPTVMFKGVVTWSVDGAGFGGMYTYMAELPPECVYETPSKTPEGILDWKSIDWIKHPDNKGVAHFIPGCIDRVLFDNNCFQHHCEYEDGKLIKLQSEIIDASIEDIENEEELTSLLFHPYMKQSRVFI